MRKRIGIFGANEESLRLVRLLADSADVEVVRIYATDVDAALECAGGLGAGLAAGIEPLLTTDAAELYGAGDLHAIVDSDGGGALLAQYPDAASHSTQIVTPLTGRLLWGYGVAPRDRKTELLQALHEVVESVELTIDSNELFSRMLEIAVSVTGAEGGSLMLLDPERRELRIRVAEGVEPELWSKIRVGLGEGISGFVARTARPLHVRGKADRRAFQIVRERLDIESALCVPLVHEGAVLGVLNVHHATRADAFADEDLVFMEQLASTLR